MNRIYIIGTVGSGKTTLAKKISSDKKIPFYELDNVVWEYHANGDIKRTDEEIDRLFKKIIKHDRWIIEDVGRDNFREGLKKADIVIFLDISPKVRNQRIIKRWFKQKLHIEKSRYKPTFKMLLQMFEWSNKDERNKQIIIDKLKTYSKKLIILNEKTINKLDILSEIMSDI